MTTQIPLQALDADAKFFNTRVLDGVSAAASQQPSALDTPLQVEFGPAVGSAATAVQLSTAGEVTVNQSGIYRIEVSLQFGRTGGAGVSQLAFRALLNGVQAGVTIRADIDAATLLVPFNEKSTLNLTAGQVLTWELMRVSTGGGNNSGGLFARSVSAGWLGSVCAKIRIDKLR